LWSRRKTVPKSIKEVMKSDPVTIEAAAPVSEAAKAMRDADIGDVIVLDDADQVCGILTDRDIAVRLVAEGRDPTQTKLGEVCSGEVFALKPDDSVSDAVRLMSEKAVRRLPVLDGGKAVGIVSLGDLAETQDPESALADISAAPPNN
jgi:CBS domain-containing protein